MPLSRSESFFSLSLERERSGGRNGPSMQVHGGIRVRETPKVLRVRSLFGRAGETKRYALSLKRSLSLPARTSECLWEHSRCLSSACIRSGCSYCDASGEFCLPSLRSSPLLLRVSIKKKKVSVAARLSVHPSERSPTLPNSCLGSAFDRLKMNSSRPSARYHSR